MHPMLNFFRRHLKIIIWLVVLSFAGYGGYSFTSINQRSTGHAGEVFGKKISQKDYLLTLRYYELLLESQLRGQAAAEALAQDDTSGENIESTDERYDSEIPFAEEPAADAAQPPETEPAAGLGETADDQPTEEVPESPESSSEEGPNEFERIRGLTWQTLILSEEAKRTGIRVTDQEVSHEVMRLFSTEAGFNSHIYQKWIETRFQGRARDFEEVVRKDIAARKVRERVVKDASEDDLQTTWLTWFMDFLNRAHFKDYEQQNLTPASQLS
jgi:hypothetical protein